MSATYMHMHMSGKVQGKYHPLPHSHAGAQRRTLGGSGTHLDRAAVMAAPRDMDPGAAFLDATARQSASASPHTSSSGMSPGAAAASSVSVSGGAGAAGPCVVMSEHWVSPKERRTNAKANTTSSANSSQKKHEYEV